MSTVHRLESGYMITEDEQFGVIKVSRVLSLIEDLLMMQDLRHGDYRINPAGLQCLLGMLRESLDPMVVATHDDASRYVASLERPPMDLLVEAIEAASGRVDPAQARTTLDSLRRTAGYLPVADALHSVMRHDVAEAWSD